MDIVFFFQSTTGQSWRHKLAGAYRFAREHDWYIHVIKDSASSDDIRSDFQNWKPIGCLVDCAMGRGNAVDELFADIPTVFLDRNDIDRIGHHPRLVHDSRAEASLAGGELLNLNCRSYAYFGTGKGYFWDTERLEQFRSEVCAAGKPFTDLTQTMITESIAKLPKPCGILAANDLAAMDVFHAATALGFAIGDDIAIAGIDNDEMLCESVSPGLTSADPDFDSVGYRLAEMLFGELSRSCRHRRRRGLPKTEHYRPARLVRRGSTMPSGSISVRIRRAIEYIRRHACERTLDIDAVADEMKCSRRLATMCFRRETGHSILDEILDRRIARACELLETTSMPIATITVQCGYYSSAHLMKQFAKRTGMTMREWRNANHDHHRPHL